MLSYTNTTAANPSGSPTYTIGAAVLAGGTAYEFLWSPTARDITNLAGVVQPSAISAARTSQTCFIRGVSETVHCQTSSSIPWQWRRIVFTYKGPTFVNGAPTNTALATETSNGMVRVVNSWAASAVPRNLIFKGVQGTDWNDAIIAPIDTTNITVKYDKVMTIKSGNDMGINIVKKFWHPANQNLVYNDDEFGQTEQTSFFSTPSKPGMGDMYIYDLVFPSLGATTTDLLSWEPCATLYWHEK